MSARIIDQAATNNRAKAGVMIRANTTPGSPHYYVFWSPIYGVNIDYRIQQNGPTTQIVLPGIERSQTWNGRTIHVMLPAIDARNLSLRFARAGGRFMAAVSPDSGRTWRTLSSVSATITMPPAVLVGLAVSSHDMIRRS